MLAELSLAAPVVPFIPLIVGLAAVGVQAASSAGAFGSNIAKGIDPSGLIDDNRKERARLNARQGRQSTILGGAQTLGQPEIGKTLLGGATQQAPGI